MYVKILLIKKKKNSVYWCDLRKLTGYLAGFVGLFFMSESL